MIVRTVLNILVRMIEIYSWLCFIRIILTWIPGASFTRFGAFLASLCDPFLNLFRNVRALQFGALDFSPALSIGLLYAVSAILRNILYTGRIYFGGILAIVISMIWSIVSSLLFFLFILLGIRFAVSLFQKSSNYYGSFWSNLDYALEPFVHKLSNIVTRGKKFVSYRTSLAISIAMLIVIYIAGKLLAGILVMYAYRIPF